MPLESCIHAMIQDRKLSRIITDQMWTNFLQSGTHAFGISWQIERPQRTHFTVTDQTTIRFDPDDGAVKNRDRLTARPLVSPLVQRKVNAMREDTGDFHGRL